MLSGAPKYDLERDLVTEFLFRMFATNSEVFDIAGYGLEFDYQRGRADVVAISADGRVLAFEAKLRAWREALHQAYRNLCFAELSYVVLPATTAARAVEHLGEFRARGVGLCCMLADGILVLHPAQLQASPLQPWLRERASAFASSATGISNQ